MWVDVVDVDPFVLGKAYNIHAREVKRGDLRKSSVNAGFEIRGNYDCEVEFKNFNIIGYDKIEK